MSAATFLVLYLDQLRERFPDSSIEMQSQIKINKLLESQSGSQSRGFMGSAVTHSRVPMKSQILVASEGGGDGSFVS